LNHPNNGYLVVHLDLNKPFTLGGRHGVECFAEVVMCDLNVGKWIYIQPMPPQQFAPVAADIHGTFYVVGGYNG
jgi:hypothetical protein